MKKIIFLGLTLGLFTVACKSDKQTQLTEVLIETSTKEGERNSSSDVQKLTHKIDIETSEVLWKGFKPTGSHHGVISLKEGGVQYDGTNIKTGYFILDMTSIVNLDMPADDPYNQKLITHLKSPDFFDTAAHPTALFTITDASQTNITGDLTIKGITKSITFPVNITEKDGGLQLTANAFQIDRTEFNIQYKSKKFFDNLKDKFINDKFEIAFDVSLK